MKVSVLIPTYNRLTALATTLTALLGQTFNDFEIVIANQGDNILKEHAVIQTINKLFDLYGNAFRILSNKPPQGMAHQRQFLLNASKGRYALFLDDDVILEKNVVERLVKALDEERCGFAGMGLIGLSFKDDVREDEQDIEWWDSPIQPETIHPGSREWKRHRLHNAANLLHAADKLPPGEERKYKIAWVGGCVLYDAQKLKSIGGFQFWKQLPSAHCGEDVLIQLKLMKEYGGFGLLPSGAFHQELPTTLPDRELNAPEYLYAF